VRLILATKNSHKVAEIKAILSNFNWEIIPMYELKNNIEIIEDGATFEENARKKAEIVCGQTGYISMGEDTGLEVDALNGQPGVYSARFAGEKATYEQNVQKILKLLKDVKKPNRIARFRCVCTLAFPSTYKRTTETFEGVCEGQIIEEPRGKGGFGYDPVFVPDGFEQTFAELHAQVKNKISHRAQALEKVRKYLEQIRINEQ
jgi:XTP/dITP diphosphohydrolase